MAKQWSDDDDTLKKPANWSYDEDKTRQIKIKQGYRYKAAFNAVTYPLVHLGNKKITPRRAIIALRRNWNFRLAQLRKKGANENWLRWMERCSDFGTNLPTSKFCNRPFWCPYCYARSYVLRIYDVLEKYLFRPGRKYSQRNVHLLAFETIHLREWHDLPSFEDAVMDTLNDIHHTSDQRNREVFADVASRGDVVFHRIDSVRIEGVNNLRLRRSGLIVAQNDVSPPRGTTCRWWMLPVEMRKELVDAVVLITKVPHLWWRQTTNTLAALDLIRGVRMLTFHGCLRSSYHL